VTNTATVTILFTDVVGSTAMRTGRGDDAAHRLLQMHNDLVRREIERQGGEEVKTIGDSFMVAFGSARKAVECAIAVQRALALRHAQGELVAGFVPIHVRIGLNVGEAIQEGGDYFSAAVDAAARVMAKANGGQILVSETVRAVIGATKDIQFVDRGRFRLKGFDERWRLFEVAWREEAPAFEPALLERTPFVARDEERKTLCRLLDQVQQGRGALVMLGGEPGVGKTRLTEELTVEARARNFFTVAGHCYEMEGAPPYIPFSEMLEHVCRVVPPDLLRETLGDAAPEVAKLTPRVRQLFPALPPPIELPPQQGRHFLFDNFAEYLERAANRQRLLLVLEDLHWADDAPLVLVEHLARRLPRLPVLIVGTYRDVELDVSRPLARTLEQATRQHLAQRISLKRFGPEGVSAMLKVAPALAKERLAATARLAYRTRALVLAQLSATIRAICRLAIPRFESFPVAGWAGLPSLARDT